MAKKQKEWARKKTHELRELLGNKCARCGSKKDLEFDVIVPDGNDHHRRYDWSHRLSFYRFHLKANNLQLLCSHCNGWKGDNMYDFRGTNGEQKKLDLL